MVTRRFANLYSAGFGAGLKFWRLLQLRVLKLGGNEDGNHGLWSHAEAERKSEVPVEWEPRGAYITPNLEAS